MVQLRGSHEAGNSQWWYSDAFPWNINPLREYREQKGSRCLSGLCVQHSSHLLAALTTDGQKRWWNCCLGCTLGFSPGQQRQSQTIHISVCPKTEESWQDVPQTLTREWKHGSENGCPNISDVVSLVFGSGRLRFRVRGCPGAAGSVWGAQEKDTGCPRAASSTSRLSRCFLQSEGNATGRLCPSSSGKFFLCVIKRQHLNGQSKCNLFISAFTFSVFPQQLLFSDARVLVWQLLQFVAVWLEETLWMTLSSLSQGSAFLGGFLDPCNSSFCLALGCHLPRGYQRTC